MAVVSVTNNNTRHDAAETTTNWTKIGNSLAQEPDFFYQGSFSISSKVGTSLGGHSCSTGTTRNMSGTANLNVVILKLLVTNKNVLDGDTAGQTGQKVRIGSGSSDFHNYTIADDGTIEATTGAKPGDRVYPALGGYLIRPIDPNVEAWRQATNGSPTLSAVDYFAHTATFTGTSKAENVSTDAIDLGPGLYLVGGDSTDPDGTMQFFIDHDEGDETNGRFGHVSTREGVIYLFGTFTIGETASGTDTATVFQDELRTLVFPGGSVDEGWNGFDFELANASTDIDINNFSVTGTGRDDLKHFFDSSADQVDGTNNEIDITGHGFFTGEYVIYSAEGGTQISGLVDGDGYFVRAVSENAIALYGSRLGSYDDIGRANITAASTGESHSVRRSPDTRPDFSARGTAGALDFTTCTFISCRNFVGTTAVTYTSTLFVGCKNLDLNGAVMTDCTIQDFLLAEGEPAVTTNDLGDITNSVFLRTAGLGQLGHAIEIDTAGTYGFSNNTFTGWGPDKASFDAQSGVNGSTEVITTDAAHGFVDGDAVYYGDEGGTPLSGLTDGQRYYANAITTTTLSLHVTRADAVADANRVNLTAAGASETHYLYSAHAALLNSSGGLVTVNVTGGTQPSVRNTPGSTTTVNVSVPLTFEAVDKDDLPIESVRVTGYLVANDAEVINTTTNASGIATAQFSGATPADIYYRYRKSSPGATKYVNISGFATIETGTGATVKRNMRVDDTADPAL